MERRGVRMADRQGFALFASAEQPQFELFADRGHSATSSRKGSCEAERTPKYCAVSLSHSSRVVRLRRRRGYARRKHGHQRVHQWLRRRAPVIPDDC